MLALFVLAFFVLAVINYKFAGGALLHPAFVFCALWAFDLFLIWAVGDLFFPLLPETLGYLLCGALMFSAGCFAASSVSSDTPYMKGMLGRTSDRILTALVVIVAVGTPFFCRWVLQLVNDYGGSQSFLFLARTSIMNETGTSWAFTGFGTLSDVAVIVAIIAFYERKNNPLRATVAVIAAFLMQILLAKKEGAFTLVVGLICVEWMRIRRVNWRIFVAAVLVFVLIASVVELYVHIGGDSLAENVVPIANNLALYASGGIVAFDRVAREPNIIPRVNLFKDLYLRVLRKMGYHEEIIDNAEFVSIGPDNTDNVYTMYWSYQIFGYVGALALTALLGFVVMLVYRKAVSGSPVWIVFYAVHLLRGILLGTFNDHFLVPYFIFEALGVSWLVYSFPTAWARFLSSAGTDREQVTLRP